MTDEKWSSIRKKVRPQARRQMLIFFAINIVLVTLFSITNNSLVFVLQIGFVVGWFIGGVLSHSEGMQAELAIIEAMYGEEWDRYAVLGRHVSQAPNN